MPRIPDPEPGLVIGYVYLWNQEHRTGRMEGRKDRPCVIVLALTREAHGAKYVTVLPITHSEPATTGEAIEIPAPVKRHLGLDEQRSWVVVSEGNAFLWPGSDLRKVARRERYDYGFLPPRFFNQIREAFITRYAVSRTLTRRD